MKKYRSYLKEIKKESRIFTTNGKKEGKIPLSEIALPLFEHFGRGMFVIEEGYPLWYYSPKGNDLKELYHTFIESYDPQKEYVVYDASSEWAKTFTIRLDSPHQLHFNLKGNASLQEAIEDLFENNDKIAAQAILRWLSI